MGNLSGLFCPYCGAPFNPSKKTNIKCEYCGCVVSYCIPGTELAAQIKELIQPVDDFRQTNSRVLDLKAKLDAANTKLNNFSNLRELKDLVIPFIVFLFSATILGNQSILSSLLLSVLSFVYLFLRRKMKTHKLQKHASAIDAEYKEATEHLTQLVNTYDFDLIPEEYRSKQPMMFFIKVLNNGRALSLRDAINLYEEDLHRKEVLKLKAEQNKLQAEQNKLQRQHLMEEKEFHEQQLELAKKKKGVDWGTVLTAAGSVAAVALSVNRKKKWF